MTDGDARTTEMAKFPPRVCQPDEWRRLSDNPKFIDIEENRELRAIPAKLPEKKTRRKPQRNRQTRESKLLRRVAAYAETTKLPKHSGPAA